GRVGRGGECARRPTHQRARQPCERVGGPDQRGTDDRASHATRAAPRVRGTMDTDPISVVSALVETGSIDTVYRDLYLGRARALLSPALPGGDFNRTERQQA